MKWNVPIFFQFVDNDGLQMPTAIHNLLGVLLFRRNRFREALLSFETAIEIDPNNINGLEHCTVMYEKLYCDEDAKNTRVKLSQVSFEIIARATNTCTITGNFCT